MSFVSVSTHVPAPSYQTKDPELSGMPTEAEARAHNGSLVFAATLGKALRNRVSHCTFERSIISKLPLADHGNLARVCQAFLTEHRPAIQALEGRFGWTGSGENRKRRTIDLPDGMGYDSKAEASAKMLELLIEDMARTQFGVHAWVRRNHPNGLGQPQLSPLGILALCNVYTWQGEPRMLIEKKLADKRNVSMFHMMSRINDFIKHRDLQGDVKFAEAIVASYAERTSPEEIPVK